VIRGVVGATLSIACLAVASCGGDDASSTDDSDTSATTPPVTSEPTSATETTIATTIESTSAITTEPVTSVAPDTTVALDALPEELVIDDIAGVTSIDAEPFPDWVTIAGGAAWVANVGTGVVGYDLTTAEPLFDVAVGNAICLAMDATPDALWVGNCETTQLVRINTGDGTIAATIDLPFDAIIEESSIAASETAVWILSSGPGAEIARVDPATNTVVMTFEAPLGASALRYFEDALWASDSVNEVVHRLDVNSGAEVATIDVGDGARFLAVGEGAVWVMNNRAGTVSQIDPVSNTVAATIVVSEHEVNGGDIAVGGGFVWARVSDVVLAQIDPATATVVARYGPSAGSGSVAADDAAVWVSAHDDFRVWRIPIDG
jgi:virginiamycin B lyase